MVVMIDDDGVCEMIRLCEMGDGSDGDDAVSGIGGLVVKVLRLCGGEGFMRCCCGDA